MIPSTGIWTIVATTVSDVNDALAEVQYIPATDWEYDFTNLYYWKILVQSNYLVPYLLQRHL